MPRRTLGLSALLLCVAGCVGTDTGNPPLSASLTANSSDSAVVIAPASGELVIESAWLSLASVRVVLGETCDHVSDPYDEDVRGDVTGSVALAGLPAGASCGVHLAPGALAELPPGAPPALAGNVLAVTGRLADGTAFELTSAHAVGVDVVAVAPLALADDDALLVTLDLAWVASLDLAAAAPDPDGVIRVAPGHPSAAALDAAFAGSFNLFRDLDGDGRLGSAEEAMGPLATSHHP